VQSRPDNTYYAATSLSEAGLSVSVDQVEASLTASFFHRVDQWLTGGMASLLPEYRQSLAWVGEEITLTLDKERTRVVRGTLIGIDEVGCLVLQGAEGERRFATGDISAPTT
jgi:biotin-(acetyl-CoA carboxylase) ligase